MQNLPTGRLIDELFARQNLDTTEMSYAQGSDMIVEATELEALTTLYVFSPEEGWGRYPRVSYGLTTGRCDVVLARPSPWITATILSTGVSRRRRETRDDIIIPYQAGPNANPEDARFILGASPGGHGIYGTSSLDRVPTEEAIESQAVALKTICCQTA